MTINRMKLIIAAATAGALVAGAGTGAMAAPPSAKAAKKSPSVVLKTVDLKRHTPINFYNVDPVTDSPIKVTARVTDSSGQGMDQGTTLSMTLAQYSKKVRGVAVDKPIVGPIALVLKWTKGKKAKSFAGTVESAALSQIREALMSHPGQSISMCLSTPPVASPSTQLALSTKMRKRLDTGRGIAVGDCVNLTFKDPATTAPPTDTVAPPSGTTTDGSGSPTGGTTTTPGTTTTTPGTTTTTPGTTTTTPGTGTTDAAPTVVVRVKAVDRGNKLYVNVNPNKGKGYWRFQVQRKKGNGTWKSLSTYRTYGTKEIRRLDLKKGTYRVVVRPKYGHLGATSAEVVLKR